MASNNQPDRWEATLLAVVMAIAGVPFLFDKLGSLVRTSFLSMAVVHSAPGLLVAVGAILLLAEQGGMTSESGRREKRGGRHELQERWHQFRVDDRRAADPGWNRVKQRLGREVAGSRRVGEQRTGRRHNSWNNWWSRMGAVSR